MAKQQQFLDVIDRDLAESRFRDAIHLAPLSSESITLPDALGRVLADDLVTEVDVPSFDRSNYDGFAIRAADTFGASEERPREVQLTGEIINPGHVPINTIQQGTASTIATGGMLPRGADAVVMIEHTDVQDNTLIIRRAVTAGFGIAFTGTDMAMGETVLTAGTRLTARETGVLAAVGIGQVDVVRQVHVAIISTGDELIEPGETMQPGMVFDSNARIIADTVRQLGGHPVPMGIVNDDLNALRECLQQALKQADVVILSGGTSKGAGDISYHAVAELTDPGIVAHGVALKPGKPICLAASDGKPVVILPGFPTSAIFTFHEFVAPVIRQLGGYSANARVTAPAKLAVKINSEIGRTEYVLVGLVERGAEQQPGLAAYPMGRGSGSVTTFSRADGFLTIGRHEEIVAADSTVEVQLLDRDLQVADLVVIGSHCIGLDLLLSRLAKQDWKTKFLAVGSTGGLAAARRGECDVAGIHLLDKETGCYNKHLLDETLELQAGYGRSQGVVFRPGDARFTGKTAQSAIAVVKSDPDCLMVNRNQGSGTRILIDQLLAGETPAGYAVQAKSHNAVAAAVAQERADWGIAIEGVATAAGLEFLPLADEQYDFVIPRSRRKRPAVEAFCALLEEEAVAEELVKLGFVVE